MGILTAVAEYFHVIRFTVIYFWNVVLFPKQKNF